MPRVLFTALDGSTVEVASRNAFRRAGSTAFAVAKIGTHLQEFGAGDLEFGETVSRGLDIPLTEEYRLQGGRLRIGSKAEYDPQSKARSTMRLGVWEGTATSIRTVIYNGTSADLLSLFNQFRIRETPTGVVLTPAAHGVSIVKDGVHAPDVVTHIEGVGLVDIFRLTRDKVAGLPPWGGMPVTDGEIYVEHNNPPDIVTLVVVTPSAMARITADDEFEEAGFISAASDLQVRWSE